MPTTRILAVDDDPANLEVIREIFEAGHEVFLASSADGIVDLVASHRPDLVLMDIGMPGLDGYEACRRLRDDVRTRHVKIILVSARSMTSDRLKGYRVGADDYLVKPFDKDELTAKVHVFLRLKSVDELDSLKSVLLELVAHQIRTPMAEIVPAAERLREASELAEVDRVRLGRRIHEGGQRLLELTNTGLVLCEFLSGTVELVCEPLVVAATVRRVVGELAADRPELRLSPGRGADPGFRVVADRRYLSHGLRMLVEQTSALAGAGAIVSVGLVERTDCVEVACCAHGDAIPAHARARACRALASGRAELPSSEADVVLAAIREIFEAQGARVVLHDGPESELELAVELPRAPVRSELRF